MSVTDWSILLAYFIAVIGIGIYYARRAGRNTEEYFLSGRKLPWWLAGLSMVATTFAADTPLAVTELVATRGIAGNWLWWNMAIGGMMTVLFYARNWRRAGIMTDLEFIEIRYSGKPAAFLRAFRSVYLGLFMNAIIMGWVNVAMGSILHVMFGIPMTQVFYFIAAAMLFTALYSSLSGLWGVAVADVIQFVIAMAGCIVLAILVLNSSEIGGVAGLTSALPADSLRLLPVIGGIEDGVSGVLALSGGAFLAYIGVQWWASWYPGAEPGGGGYVAQRMMSTRSERHAVLSVLLFQLAHYCLRPWPWILVGLATLVLYPELGEADKKLGYVYAMKDFLPSGLKGLLVATFFAAYMSTIATHLNWGSSYLVHDLFRRFSSRQRDERYYVRMSRIITMVLMLTSLMLTLVIDSISGAWQFIIECGAGLGLVLLLRWYWWRVNAWSEIVATITPVVTYACLTLYNASMPSASQILFPWSMFLIVGATTAAWLTATYITAPTDIATLDAFFTRVRPGGAWKPIASRHPDVHVEFVAAPRILGWLLGVLFIYSVLFFIGALLFGSVLEQWLWSSCAVLSAFGLYVVLRRIEERSDHDVHIRT